MNKNEIEGSWNAEKSKLKQKFALLTDDDLTLGEDKNEELLKRLQVKLGKTKEELHTLLCELFFVSFINKNND